MCGLVTVSQKRLGEGGKGGVCPSKGKPLQLSRGDRGRGLCSLGLSIALLFARGGGKKGRGNDTLGRTKLCLLPASARKAIGLKGSEGGDGI